MFRGCHSAAKQGPSVRELQMVRVQGCDSLRSLWPRACLVHCQQVWVEVSCGMQRR